MAISEGPFRRILDLEGETYFPCSALPVMKESDWWQSAVDPTYVALGYSPGVAPANWTNFQSDANGHILRSVTAGCIGYTAYWDHGTYGLMPSTPFLPVLGGIFVTPDYGTTACGNTAGEPVAEGYNGFNFNGFLAGVSFLPGLTPLITNINTAITTAFGVSEAAAGCTPLSRGISGFAFGNFPTFQPHPGTGQPGARSAMTDGMFTRGVIISTVGPLSSGSSGGFSEVVWFGPEPVIRDSSNNLRRLFLNGNGLADTSSEFVGAGLSGTLNVIGNEGNPSNGYALTNGSALNLNGSVISTSVISIPSQVEYISGVGYVTSRTNVPATNVFFINGTLCALADPELRIKKPPSYFEGNPVDKLIRWASSTEDAVWTDYAFSTSDFMVLNAVTANSEIGGGKAFLGILLKYNGMSGGVAQFDYFTGDYLTSRIGYELIGDQYPPFMNDLTLTPISVPGPVYPTMIRDSVNGIGPSYGSNYYGTYTHGSEPDNNLCEDCVGFYEATDVYYCRDEFLTLYTQSFPLPESRRNWGLGIGFDDSGGGSPPTRQHVF